MKAQLASLLLLVMPVAGFAAPESGLLRLPESWVPYVERVKPEEISLVENTVRESLSEQSDLVLYTCDGTDKVYLSYTVRKDESGYRLEMFDYGGETRGPFKRAVRLPADVAERLLNCFEFLLTKQVYPIQENLPSRDERSIVWVHLRTPENGRALGKIIVPGERCWMGVPDNKRAFFAILYHMRAWAQQSESASLIELDIALSNLRRSYPSKT